ncbi:hypothetical protein BH11PSE14_BH11PSE14_03890 [soil metagenome]
MVNVESVSRHVVKDDAALPDQAIQLLRRELLGNQTLQQATAPNADIHDLANLIDQKSQSRNKKHPSKLTYPGLREVDLTKCPARHEQWADKHKRSDTAAQAVVEITNFLPELLTRAMEQLRVDRRPPPVSIAPSAQRENDCEGHEKRQERGSQNNQIR